MKRRATKRERAKEYIIELADYIGEDSLTSAERFISATEAAIQFLLETPGAGARREFLHPSLEGIRVWPIRGFQKHLIFYREMAEGIEVVRVLHAARDLEALFAEEDLEGS